MLQRGLWKYVLVLGVALALLVLVWGAIYLVWSSGLAEAGDALALGEVCLTSIALPVTLVALLYATEEFRRTQERPKLDLYFTTASGEMVKDSTVELHVGEYATVQLVLLNHGPVVCVWYMLEFEVPAELTAKRWEELAFKAIVGGKGNWAFSHRQGARLHTFMSGGEVAVYPNYPLVLADVPVALYPDRPCPPQCRLRYKIATERGASKADFLTLRVVQQ